MRGTKMHVSRVYNAYVNIMFYLLVFYITYEYVIIKYDLFTNAM